MNVGIIGCGAIARKRAAALEACGDEVIACYDVDEQRAHRFGFGLYMDPEPLALASDAVIVCTTHDALFPMAGRALLEGKPVFVEKPGAVSLEELEQLAKISREVNLPLHVGYNHRFHHAGRVLRNELTEHLNYSPSDPVLYVSGFYGHGGRVDYDREWRCQAARGGGELLDQATHLIDLAQWFMGPIAGVDGRALRRYEWSDEVEDNAFLLLQGRGDQVAQLHASWTSWVNRFRFEVTTSTCLWVWEGLGGSYGLERLSRYAMMPGREGKRPWGVTSEFPDDESWELEWRAFQSEVTSGKPSPSLTSALEVLRVVELARGH